MGKEGGSDGHKAPRGHKGTERLQTKDLSRWKQQSYLTGTSLWPSWHLQALHRS